MSKNVKFLFHKKRKIERPVNVLLKDPGDYDLISLEDEIKDLIEKTKKVVPNGNNKNKPQRFDEQPEVMDIAVRYLKVARSIQRPYDVNHAVKIAVHEWDSRRPILPQVVYNPLKKEYWIIEGNHTSIAEGYRAATGKYPDWDSKHWLDFPVRCQVVILKPDENGEINMSFARDMFEGTNKTDRLKLDYFDLYKNLVLRVRQDCYGRVENCDHNKSKKMYAIQLACEANDLCPTHPRAGRDTTLAGSITNVDALMKMSVDGVNFTGKHHKKFWDHLKVDSIELLPMEKLRSIINKNKTNPDEFQSKEHTTFMYEFAVIQQKFGGSPAGFREFATTVWQEYYRRSKGSLADKKIPDPDKDFSLVLLLKLHKKAGYSYNCIPNDIYKQFVENSVDCVDCLAPSKQKILKDFV